MKYLIIGVDPGITAAIACLDLNGNLVMIKSGRKLNYNKMIKLISEVGRPIIISTDVMHLPDLIKRLAAEYKSKIILPKKNLRIEEKSRIVNDYFDNLKLENDHQRDALASAIFAYEKVKPLFDRIERILIKEGKEDEIDDVKKKIVLGEASNIKSALKKREQNEEYQEFMYEQKRDEKLERLNDKLKELNRVISKLKKENKKSTPKYVVKDKKLLNIINKKEDTIIKLNEEILDYQIKIKNLEDKINKINLKMKYIMKGLIPVVKLKSPKEILKLDYSYYGHAVTFEEYFEFGKKVRDRIKKLDLKLTKGKTKKINGLEFLIEGEDVVEKIQKIINSWRKRDY